MNFPSLQAFSRHMATLTIEERAIDTLARAGVATVLTRKVKEKIGDPARLLPPLAASTIAKKGNDLPLVDTGALKESITWRHMSPRRTVVGSTEDKAIWHELGPVHGRYPKRPFLAPTAEEENVGLFELYAKAMRAFLTRSRPEAAITMSATGVSRRVQ